MKAAPVAAVAAGGAVGGVLRHGVAVVVPGDEWSTLLVNVAGCLVAGVLVTVLGGASAPPRLFRPFVVVGVLGGFTTLSTFVVDVLRLVSAGRVSVVLGYALLMVLGTLSAAFVGVVASRPLRAGERA